MFPAIVMYFLIINSGHFFFLKRESTFYSFFFMHLFFWNNVQNMFIDSGFLYFQYHEEMDVGFGSSLACSLVLLFLVGGVQAVILPRTIILLLLFLTAFIWISVVLMLLLAVRLRWIIWDISQSFLLRLAITVFSIILVYTVAQVNVVCIQILCFII